jgi:hypothetical protein
VNIEYRTDEYRMSKWALRLGIFDIPSLAQGSNPVFIIMRVRPAFAAKVG